MIKDIVTRLEQAECSYGCHTDDLAHEAGVEIKRLRTLICSISGIIIYPDSCTGFYAMFYSYSKDGKDFQRVWTRSVATGREAIDLAMNGEIEPSLLRSIMTRKPDWF